MRWRLSDSRGRVGVLLGLLVAATASAAGCTDARFHTASAIRTARIDGLLDRARAREDQSTLRLARDQRDWVRSVDRHRDRLQTDIALLDHIMQREVDRWPTRRRRTSDFVRDYLDGNLARADRTIPRLVY